METHNPYHKPFIQRSCALMALRRGIPKYKLEAQRQAELKKHLRMLEDMGKAACISLPSK